MEITLQYMFLYYIASYGSTMTRTLPFQGTNPSTWCKPVDTDYIGGRGGGEGATIEKEEKMAKTGRGEVIEGEKNRWRNASGDLSHPSTDHSALGYCSLARSVSIDALVDLCNLQLNY